MKDVLLKVPLYDAVINDWAEKSGRPTRALRTN
jgi:hypothetical protein